MGGGGGESREDKRERHLQRRMAELERKGAAQRNARTLTSDIFSVYGGQRREPGSGGSGLLGSIFQMMGQN